MPPLVVFVRVASKGLAAYGEWKSAEQPGGKGDRGGKEAKEKHGEGAAKGATPRVFRKRAEHEEKKGAGGKSGRVKSEKSAEEEGSKGDRGRKGSRGRGEQRRDWATGGPRPFEAQGKAEIHDPC